MAIFAPSSSPGYGDPYRALTIKALEKRQADLARQMAEATIPKAETPAAIGGVGLGAIGDILQRRNADQALAARKQELAGLMAGIDPTKGPTPQQQAQLYGMDPELGAKFMTQQYETGRDTRKYEQEDLARKDTQQFQTTERLGQQQFQGGENAATRAQQAKIAAEANQLQLDLADKAALSRRELAMAERDWKSSEAELERAHKTGETQLINQLQMKRDAAQQNFELKKQAADQAWKDSQPRTDAAQAAADAANPKIPLTPAQAQQNVENKLATDIKAPVINARDTIESKYIQTGQAINNLHRLTGILKEGVDKGFAEPARTAIATATGGRFTPGTDLKRAERTVEYKTLLEQMATKEMSQALTGSTTNFELQHFIKIFNNPQSSDKDREDALANLMRVASAYQFSQANNLRALKGDPAALDARLGTPADRARKPDDPAAAAAAAPAAAAPAPAATAMSPADVEASLANARKAIQGGKDPEFIKNELRKNGIDPARL